MGGVGPRGWGSSNQQDNLYKVDLYTCVCACCEYVGGKGLICVGHYL